MDSVELQKREFESSNAHFFRGDLTEGRTEDQPPRAFVGLFGTNRTEASATQASGLPKYFLRALEMRIGSGLKGQLVRTSVCPCFLELPLQLGSFCVARFAKTQHKVSSKANQLNIRRHHSFK